MADDEPVKLRRPYLDRAFGLFFGVLALAADAVLVYSLATAATHHGLPAGVRGWLVGGASVLLILWFAGWTMWHAVRPFRIDVDPQGWSVRTPKLNRYLRWDEIAGVVLADAPAVESWRAAPAPRLLLVPAAGVSLGVPLTEQSPMDGRAALELFRLDDVDYGDTQLAQDLAVLAGDRFHNLCRHPTRPVGALPLRRFPDESDHARLMRWLDRRKALLFVGWYVLVLVPPLILIVLAAQLNELLGIAVLGVGVLAIGTITLKVWGTFGGCRNLADQAAMIDGSDLVTSFGDRSDRTSLHSGRITVLRPGTLKGYGKAWLFAHEGHKGNPVPDLLLSDPRTGRLRGGDDLNALATVLRASPDDRDRAAGRQLDDLAAQASASESWLSTPRSDDSHVYDAIYGLWRALKGLGRTIPLLVVVLTVALAGGWVVENSTVVGPALIFAAAGLGGLWICYALYRTLGLVGELLTTVVRAFR